MNFNINDKDFSIWLSENISDIEDNYNLHGQMETKVIEN